MSTIGKAIQYHLELNGCSQYKLAQRLVISRSVIAKLCSDESNPTFGTLIKIANALGCTVTDIARTAEAMKNESND